MGNQRLKSRLPWISLLLLLVLGTLQPVSASLVFQSDIDLGATGLGNVLTILTIQDNPTESGCVSWNGTVDVIGGRCAGGILAGDEKTGAGQTLTRAISEVTGLTLASELVIIFNAQESGGNAVILNNLVLTFYSPTGLLIHSYAFTGSNIHAGVNTGTGGSGYVYRLDYDQYTDAQSRVFDQLDFGDYRIGLAAAVSEASGAGESFFITQNTDILPVPEPATFLTVGAGLFGAAVLLRRRRNKNRS